MSSIEVTGLLVGPLGDALYDAQIRITSVVNSNVVLYGVSSTVDTGPNGEYSFNLNDGKFLIEILTTDTYFKVAYVQVNSSIITAPVTLEGLIDLHSFCKPVAPVCPV